MDLALGAGRQVHAPPLEPEARVRLVRTVHLHSAIVGKARKGPFHLDVDQREKLFHEALDDVEEDVALGESHLDVHLRELRLAVGAQVFVAEAAHDLKIAVEARDHQDLLEQLWRLRQGVEAPVLDAAGHQIIARALGGRAR